MSSTISGVTMWKSPLKRARDEALLNFPFSSRFAVAWAMYFPSSSSAENHYLVRDAAVVTLRYGVSTKPYSLTRANVDSDAMRPMFGPSGVSIGQIRP